MSEPNAKRPKITEYTEIAPKGTSTEPIQCRTEVFALKDEMVVNRRYVTTLPHALSCFYCTIFFAEP